MVYTAWVDQAFWLPACAWCHFRHAPPAVLCRTALRCAVLCTAQGSSTKVVDRITPPALLCSSALAGLAPSSGGGGNDGGGSGDGDEEEDDT